jgi:flagellar basal body-associated protein FliL
MSRHAISPKRYILFLVMAYVLAPALLAWIGYVVFNPHGGKHLNQIGAQLEEFTGSTAQAYYDLPQLSLTVNSGGGDSTGVMKVDLSLEVSRRDLPRVPDFEPRIIARIVSYLHTKSYADMQDRFGMKELREGLVDEISRGAIPIKVSNVMVREMVFE